MIGLILLIILLIFVFYLIIIFNGIISLRNGIEKSIANIDVLLKQRNDEVPNLVNVVKGIAKQEKEIFTNIASSRASMLGSLSLSDKAKYSDQVSTQIKSIFALAENYPVLKSNQNFLELQKRLSAIENEIADRREYYNDYVMNYNNRIQSFPDVIVAKILGFKSSYELFRASDLEKQVSNIDL